MTNNDDLALKLKAAAEVATLGEWCTDDHHGVIADAGLNANFYIASCSGPEQRSNKQFIALANPANILALVEALEKVQTINAAQDDHINQQQDRINRLEKRNEELGKYAKELESRTVKLPKRSVGEVMHMSGFSRDYGEGWCSGNDNAIHEMRAAGIKWEAE